MGCYCRWHSSKERQDCRVSGDVVPQCRTC
uniref:Uncharacterized protein n=1 Tax=Arundo donax TaxID=35708 RepID=A0A0A8YMP7_ARUDO